MSNIFLMGSAKTKPLSIDEIKTQALALGFDDVGVTSPHIPDEDIKKYRQWIQRKHHADMAYMENENRCYPERLLPGAKSAFIFVTYYKQPKYDFREDAGLIASYARGRDYHHVHRHRLKKLIRWIEIRTGQKNIAKGFSDSAPVLEKALAVQAGLGWFGKNTLLIHRRFGTFTLLSGLLTTLDFKLTPTDSMHFPRCGTCQRCLDACPTQAFTAPFQLDARQCLSYHLIESKKNIPEKIAKDNPGFIFGCDICQEVCPHNTRKKTTNQADFSPEKGMGVYLTDQKIAQLKQSPEKLFGTPLQRRGVNGLSYTWARLNGCKGTKEDKHTCN